MTSNKEPRQKRKPSRIAQERRRDLIDGAIRNIAAVGYDAVTIATICEEAGFSRGLIGHYFTSKDALLLEAVKSVAHDLGEAIRTATQMAGADPAARLHALVKASFTPPGFTPEKVAVWVSLTGSARWSSPLTEVYTQIWQEYREGVGRLFEKAAKQTGVDLDARLTTITFSHLVEGLWVGWAADPTSITPSLAQACCHNYVDTVLGRSRSGE
ncbi:TetR family transcriptional regulator C-terminal domain-containing protein [Phyllobacterium sp. 22229]|uniref:TetR family transcriptional regulator C-terminal domain-containing protein n=1 Tax=Agrobacterium radiobacter TaxID=362 RepID=A0ABD5LQ85_AGRRD